MLNSQDTSRQLHIWWRDKRTILTCLLLVGLAITFWTGSRYPALNEKAAMGENAAFAGLGFETLVEVDAHTPFLTRIVYTTVNWLYTNQQGMTFGLLVAALLMTLIPLLKPHRFTHRLTNTVVGMVIGTPLGLCVNCATPIAQGIYVAGGRVETALAAMMSAPTLNIVVLTMLFTLFPFYLAAIKIGFTLAFLLLGIPLLTYLLPRLAVVMPHDRHIQARQPSRWLMPSAVEVGNSGPAETWRQALLWVGKNCGRALWYITKTAVPLMVLAGLLGSALVELLPFESLADVTPRAGLAVTLLMMGLVSLIGVFLPVPMAFDVIVTATLLQAGLPVKYAAILLFTLGIFSVYSFFMVWRTMSRVAAVAMFAVLTGLGVAAGASGHKADQWHQARQQQLLLHAFDRSANVAPLAPGREPVPAIPDHTLVSRLQRDAMLPEPMPEPLGSLDGIALARLPFREPTARPGGVFRKYPGSEVGLDVSTPGSLLRLLDPFVSLRGIASGDVHHDGWSDLLIWSEAELVLYANQQGRRYVRQPLKLPDLSQAYITSAALVDLNNDGWLDLFFSGYRAGNHIIYNQEGLFTQDNWHRLPNHAEAVATAAVAFGDLDRDGDLDIVLGNLTGTLFIRPAEQRGETSPSPRSSDNALVLNHGDTWQVTRLPEISAETWSTLFTDLNNDGYLDLLVGNDLTPPDYFYLGTGDGTLQQVTRADGVIPHSTHATMSMASADIDNDLVPELYIGQISPPDGRHISPTQLCKDIEDPGVRQQCERMHATRDTIVRSRIKRDAFLCRSLDAPHERQGCLGLNVLWTATIWQRSRATCEAFPETWDIASFLCHHSFVAHPRFPPSVLETTIPQVPISQGNVLLVRDTTGHFVDQAAAMGVQHAGWTWNAKFADLDNDEWQDLYVVNGEFYGLRRSQNSFFHNQQGLRFVDKSEAYGLASWLDTLAYAYTDIDHDGDLDIVAVPAVGPLLVYVNQLATGNAIAFALRDAGGNRFGIGSKIRISYGGGRHQMRELQAGGGYQSHDAPIAYFGLGAFDKVERVEVLWSTGEHSTLATDFPAGAQYILTRTSSAQRVDRTR